MEKEYYFDSPTQVKFWDIDGNRYVGGIAYGDKIICGCCGSVMEIKEVVEFAPSYVEPIVDMDWIDISYDIMGE